MSTTMDLDMFYQKEQPIDVAAAISVDSSIGRTVPSKTCDTTI